MLCATFLPTPGGKLYVSLFLPDERQAMLGWVLHTPAFAEEMNKARAMVSRQARALASSGYAVAVPDLFGTGDSEGEMCDADWTRWRADIDFLLRWITDQCDGPICLWGLRTGCLLALEVARSHTQHIGALLLWQPMQSGKIFINQFFRLKVAAGLFGDNRETGLCVREELDAKNYVEIAGYTLNKELVTQLEALSAESLMPPRGIKVCWIEVGTAEAKSLSPVARKVLTTWVDNNVDVKSSVVTGPPFWLTQEISFAPELINFSNHYLSVDLLPRPAKRLNINLLPPAKSPACETPMVFDCEGKELIGIFHKTDSRCKLGILLVVGGPQYRVGSHRQFVLLARETAAAGIPFFRFDYRGMGDSEGDLAGFEHVDADIKSAIDVMLANDADLEKIIIWGLCDAASAACSYAWRDTRVAALVLANPWAYSEQGEARTLLKHYYIRRVTSKAFWVKLLNGRFDAKASLNSIKQHLQISLDSKLADAGTRGSAKHKEPNEASLLQRMYEGLNRFRGPVLLILSGEDLTAREFIDGVKRHKQFRRLLENSRVTRKELAEADHTFSSRKWRNQVSTWTREWVESL